MSAIETSTYLPDKGTGCILFAFTSPVPPPEPICGGQRFRLHDLGVVYIAVNLMSVCLKENIH